MNKLGKTIFNNVMNNLDVYGYLLVLIAALSYLAWFVTTLIIH